MLVLAVALVAVAWSVYERQKETSPIEFLGPSSTGGSDLSKLWPIPDFSLTDRTGRPVTLADLKGSVWAADFIYTTCPGPCPMLTKGLAQVQKALASNPDARFVSISSDPEKDTPEVLQQYATRFGATDRWFFLTGDKAGIYTLANQGFKLSVVEDRNGAEPIIHSTKLVLVDRLGIVRGFYDGLSDEARTKMIRDFRRLLAEKP
jgi:protein SCO1/2